MISTKQLVLIGALLALVLLALFLEPEPGNEKPSPNEQQVGTRNEAVTSSKPSIIFRQPTPQMETSQSALTENAENLAIVHFIWLENRPLMGKIIRVETGEEVPFSFDGNANEGSKNFVLSVPPGNYKVRIEGEITASPSRFFVNRGLIEVTCIPVSEGTLEVFKNDIPVDNVEVFTRESRAGAWISHGKTDREGAIIDAGLRQISELLIFKPNHVLVHSTLLGHIADTQATRRVFADDQEEMTIYVASWEGKLPIRNAEVKCGPITLGRTDDLGQLTIRGKGDYWREISASAEGFLPSAKTMIMSSAPGSNHFIIRLDQQHSASIRVFPINEERAVEGAKVLAFSPDSSSAPALLWETTTDTTGTFHIPMRLPSHARLIVWDPDFGLSQTDVAEALEKQEIFLAEVPPLTLSILPSSLRDSKLKTCTAISFWGAPMLVAKHSENKYSIPGGIGAASVKIEFHSGEQLILRKTREYKRKMAFLKSDLLSAVTGTVEITPLQTSSLRGNLRDIDGSIKETDILEITFQPLDVGLENLEMWPDLSGDRPSHLRGWTFRDYSIRPSAIVGRDNSFEILGLPNGNGRLSLRNLSDKGSEISILSPESVLVPMGDALQVFIQKSLRINLLLVARDGGDNPENPIIEFSSSSTYDSNLTKQKKFYSNQITYSVGNNDTTVFRVLAAGFEPVELLLELNDEGIFDRTIEMDRIMPMQIVCEDDRSSPSEITLKFSYGRYDYFDGLMAPMGSFTTVLDENLSCELLGAFPGCDVWVSLGPLTPGEIFVRRFQFVPGGQVTINLLD